MVNPQMLTQSFPLLLPCGLRRGVPGSGALPQLQRMRSNGQASNR